jgi:hypothetical protein
MSDDKHGHDSSYLAASGAMGNVHSGAATPGGGAPGMMPFGTGEQGINVATGSIDTVVHTSSMDDAHFISNINQNAAFNKDVVGAAAGAVEHHGTSEAKGQPGLQLQNLGQAEIAGAKPPTAQGDMQMKQTGMFAGSGGAEH